MLFKSKKSGGIELFLIIIMCLIIAIFVSCYSFALRIAYDKIDKMDRAQINANLATSITDINVYGKTGNFDIGSNSILISYNFFKKVLTDSAKECNVDNIKINRYIVYTPFNPSNVGDGNKTLPPDRVKVYEYNGSFSSYIVNDLNIKTPNGVNINGLTVYSNISWKLDLGMFNFSKEYVTEKTTDMVSN